MPGAGGGVADAQRQQRALLLARGFGGGEARVHDGDERGIHQLGDQLRRGVVGSGFLALRPRRQRETRRGASEIGGYLRAVIEQAFVNGAQFLDVQMRVVDPAPDSAVVAECG